MIRYYLHIVSQILKRPRLFFSTEAVELGLRRSVCALAISSAVFVAASLLRQMPADPMTCGGVLFTNAMGMVLITSAAGYGVMRITMGNCVPFPSFFSIYAFSSSAVLLFAWIPMGTWLTEPYKWWLIGTGMTRSLGFSKGNAFLVILASIFGVAAFFNVVLHSCL